jgi:hypothetical protein
VPLNSSTKSAPVPGSVPTRTFKHESNEISFLQQYGAWLYGILVLMVYTTVVKPIIDGKSTSNLWTLVYFTSCFLVFYYYLAPMFGINTFGIVQAV